MSWLRSSKIQHLVVMIVVLPGLVGALWLTYHSQAAAGIARVINYSGKLYDSSGAVVVNGNYNMAFIIYDAATGGTLYGTTLEGIQKYFDQFALAARA